MWHQVCFTTRNSFFSFSQLQMKQLKDWLKKKNHITRAFESDEQKQLMEKRRTVFLTGSNRFIWNVWILILPSERGRDKLSQPWLLFSNMLFISSGVWLGLQVCHIHILDVCRVCVHIASGCYVWHVCADTADLYMYILLIYVHMYTEIVNILIHVYI